MSKEILFDKYGNEIVKLEVKYNDKLQSICMNCFRIGGVKWNDIDNGSFLTLTLNKKDLIDQLVENEVKFDFDEDDDGETVKQVIVDDEKYIDIEYFAKIKSDLEAKLAESEERAERNKSWHNEKAGECAELKQQLAEKDEEIKVIDEDRQFKAEMWTRFADKCKELEKQLAEKEKERHEEWKTGKEWKWEWQKVNQQLEQANQDKISFAVEQLEKVKENILLDISIGIQREWISNKIDHQIKQLKEME